MNSRCFLENVLQLHADDAGKLQQLTLRWLKRNFRAPAAPRRMAWAYAANAAMYARMSLTAKMQGDAARATEYRHASDNYVANFKSLTSRPAYPPRSSNDCHHNTSGLLRH